MDYLPSHPWRGLHGHYHLHGLDLQNVFLTAAIALSAVLVVFYKLKGARKANGRKLPPGPRPWPIVGSLGLLGPLAHQDFAKLAKKYGPIFHMRLGSVDAVIVSSPRLAEEILKTQDHIFSSRPDSAQGQIMAYGNHTIGASSYGPYWRQARKVFTLELMTHKRLQQFQTSRKEEVLFTLYSVLEACKMGTAARMDLKFGNLTKNNMTRMMINKSFFGPNTSASNLKDAAEYRDLMKELVRLFAVFNLGDYIPFLQIFDLQGYKKEMRQIQRQNDIFFDKVIDEHRQRLASQTSERDTMDLVDVLLTRPCSGDEKPFTNSQIKAVFVDVVVAGTATSSIMMEWTLTELLRHPAAMKKVQDELDNVVGQSRLVEETDIPNLTYFRAVVKETLRLHPVAPILLPHYAMEATEVAGYHVPKNSQVFVNIWAIARDPATWERPLEFEPERFLTNGMDTNGQDFELLPFGSGRRRCAGRNLGLLMLEYTMALLLHACNWSLPPGVSIKDVDLGEAPGATVFKAIPLEAVASPRLPLQIIEASKKRTP